VVPLCFSLNVTTGLGADPKVVSHTPLHPFQRRAHAVPKDVLFRTYLLKFPLRCPLGLQAFAVIRLLQLWVVLSYAPWSVVLPPDYFSLRLKAVRPFMPSHPPVSHSFELIPLPWGTFFPRLAFPFFPERFPHLHQRPVLIVEFGLPDTSLFLLARGQIFPPLTPLFALPVVS